MTDPITSQDREPALKPGRMKQVAIVVAALFGVLLLAGACEEILDDVFDLDVPVPHIHWR